MKVAFDSRPTKETRGVGRYSRCLLAALRESDRGQIVETRDPRRCDVFHAPSAEPAERRLKECGEILEEFADHVYQAGGAP